MSQITTKKDHAIRAEYFLLLIDLKKGLWGGYRTYEIDATIHKSERLIFGDEVTGKEKFVNLVLCCLHYFFNSL